MAHRAGPAGERVGRSLEVEPEPVEVDGRRVEGVAVRWLIKGGSGTPAVGLFEMEPYAHVPAHRHPWGHGILVISGVLRVRVGGRVYELDEGGFALIPPDVEHEYWSGPAGARFICVAPAEAGGGGEEPCFG